MNFSKSLDEIKLYLEHQYQKISRAPLAYKQAPLIALTMHYAMRALTEGSSAAAMEPDDAKAFAIHEARRMCSLVPFATFDLPRQTAGLVNDNQTLWEAVVSRSADPMMFHTHICAGLVGPDAFVDYIATLAPTEQAVLDHLRPSANQLRNTGETAPENASYDQLPNAYGKFGLSRTNPVPCSAEPGALLAYLLSLRKDDSALGLKITIKQLRTVACLDVTRHPIIEYCASPFSISGGAAKGYAPENLFVIPKFSFNSPRPPTGFYYFDLSTENVGETVCMHCGAIIASLFAYMEGCPVCGKGHGESKMDNLRWKCSLTAFSNKHWSTVEMHENALSIKTTNAPSRPAQQVLTEYLGESQQAESRAKFLKPARRIQL